MLTKPNCSQDHLCSLLIPWAPDTFLTAPVPREEVCFSAANQGSQCRCRQAPWPQVQPTACTSLPFTRAVFSLPKRSQLWLLSKAKILAELETEGLTPHPCLCQLWGKRELQNCSWHPHGRAKDTAPDTLSAQQPVFPPQRPARTRQLCSSPVPWVAAGSACAGKHRATGGSGSRGWLGCASQLFGREAALQMPLDFIHPFLLISNQNSHWSQGEARW